jgi:hypothetical protein
VRSGVTLPVSPRGRLKFHSKANPVNDPWSTYNRRSEAVIRGKRRAAAARAATQFERDVAERIAAGLPVFPRASEGVVTLRELLRIGRIQVKVLGRIPADTRRRFERYGFSHEQITRFLTAQDEPTDAELGDSP